MFFAKREWVKVTDVRPNPQFDVDFVTYKDKKGNSTSIGELAFSHKPNVGDEFILVTRGESFGGFRKPWFPSFSPFKKEAAPAPGNK